MAERLGPINERLLPFLKREVDKAFWSIVNVSLADIHSRSASVYLKG
jgi:hypothetical protein